VDYPPTHSGFDFFLLHYPFPHLRPFSHTKQAATEENVLMHLESFQLPRTADYLARSLRFLSLSNFLLLHFPCRSFFRRRRKTEKAFTIHRSFGKASSVWFQTLALQGA
jgi:hypothetical protein